ncbi:MAG: DEAD/DEAH box helicase [Clostridia bacterium]|nr:DEAD/DEAH box helicase [Clostridia bacterium]
MKITDDMIKSICSPTIYKRGMEYFKDGRVHIKSREESAITAIVDDEEIYNIRINFQDKAIHDCMCTCPYYQTMGTNCKHIVAVLKKRQTEINDGENYKDENDKLAQNLCMEFANSLFEKERLNLGYELNINTDQKRRCSFYIDISCGFSELKPVNGVDSFIESYINGTDFKISKHTAVNSAKYSLSENDEKIMDILAEAYQNKLNSGMYVRRVFQSMIAPATAKRLMPLLINSECSVNLNGINILGLQVMEEDPDIVIDINATDDEITLNVFESGTALFPDGSWFIYENCLYHTTPEWRGWFMPIYNSLMSESRTQIDFKGNSRIEFATYVYPKIRNKRGVATTGLDSIVINEKPVFSVYLDYKKFTLSAVVKAAYGNINVRPMKEIRDSKKIVIRDLQAESKVLSFFSQFSREEDTFTANDNKIIYEFASESINELKKYADVYTDKSFDNIYKKETDNIEVNVNYEKTTDLLKVDFKTELSSEELAGILRAIKLKEKYYRFKDGSFMDLNGKNTEKFKLLDNFGFTDKDIKNKEKILSKYHMLYIEALKHEGKVESDSAFDSLISSIKNIKADIPLYLQKVLREYQKEGVNWLKQMSELGFGGILADDMGLGKTLEVIAFVMSEKKKKPALVVAPSALVYNWLNEINKFTPDAKKKIIDGTKEERKKSLEDIYGYDFIITSYPLLRRDIEMYSELEFSYLFIDESQHIKNPDTMNAKTVKKVKAERKFALSGTPIENRLSELWSVFDFAMKGYLHTRKEFSQNYEYAQNSPEHDDALEELRKKVTPFILRRMKADVLEELPEKIENTIYSDFIPEQKRMYEAYLAYAKNEIGGLLEKGDSQMKILTILLRLRQICCYPGLFDTSYEKDSGKLILLDELVDSATSQGHRLLIFSQFTSMLDVIKKRLYKNGYDCFYIDGKTPAKIRTELAQKFNDGEKNIFLISLKAGGTGLNLTGADTVIHFDPWWNPAVMEQASDRAYRIGQKKAVQVIKLAVKGSIEERILELQEKKRNLASAVIQKNEKTISGLTREEILSLFE